MSHKLFFNFLQFRSWAAGVRIVVAASVLLGVGFSLPATASLGDLLDVLIVKIDEKAKLVRKTRSMKSFSAVAENSSLVQKITSDFAQKRWDNRSKKYLERYIRYYYEMFIHDELTLAELNTAWQYRKVKSSRNLPQQQQLTTKQLSMLKSYFNNLFLF